MTPADARRAWLEAEMRKVPMLIEKLGPNGEEVEVPDYPALAALLDAPLGEMEEALEHSDRGHAALARLPWREEGTMIQQDNVPVCRPSEFIHLRPVLLFVERHQDYNVLKQWATMRCYACGVKWLEDSKI